MGCSRVCVRVCACVATRTPAYDNDMRDKVGHKYVNMHLLHHPWWREDDKTTPGSHTHANSSFPRIISRPHRVRGAFLFSKNNLQISFRGESRRVGFLALSILCLGPGLVRAPAEEL